MEDAKDVELHALNSNTDVSMEKSSGVMHNTKYPGSKRPLNKAKRRSKGKIQRQSRKINQKKR